MPSTGVIDKFFPHHGGGGLRMVLNVMSNNRAYWAKCHHYADGRTHELASNMGHPFIVGNEYVKMLHEHEGYLAFYTAETEEDQRTIDHLAGYRRAARDYHWLMENNASEMYDEEHFWEY